MRKNCPIRDRYVRMLSFASAALPMIVLTACASTAVETTPPRVPARSVLIVTGVGMVPYAARDPRYESLWLGAARRYAEGLRTAIERTGARAELRIKRDRGIATIDYVKRLLAHEEQDALLQVTVNHERSGSVSTVFLEVSFLPLGSRRYPNGRRGVMTHTGPTERYPILSTSGKDMRNASLTGLADKFVQELRRRGAI